MTAAVLTDSARRALVRELASRNALVVTVAGDSMAPTLRRGDRVRIGPAKALWPGDVVLFETADGRDLVLHRVVIAVPGTGWFFHVGDNARGVGARPARVDRIIGRADLPRRWPRLAGLGAQAARTIKRVWRRRWSRR